MVGKGMRSASYTTAAEANQVLVAHQIGWQWFSLIARQRIQLVSFWFLSMSFLTTAGMQAFTNDRYGAAMGVAGAMAGASAVLFFLDVRTRNQLKRSRLCLDAVEKRIARQSGIQEADIASHLHDRGQMEPSYKLLFAVLYGGAFCLSLAALMVLAPLALS